MSELEDWQLALLVEARKFNDPALVESNAADALHRYGDLIDDAKEIDAPVVVDRKVKEQYEEAEALLEASSNIDGDVVVKSESQEDEDQEALNDFSEFLGAALKEEVGLKDAVVESMSASAMVNQFRDDDDGEIKIKLDSLSQQPETGGESSAEVNAENAGEGDDPESDDVPESSDEAFDALDSSRKHEVAGIARRWRALKDRTPKHAETLRSEMADILGIDADALEESDVDFDKKIEVV